MGLSDFGSEIRGKMGEDEGIFGDTKSATDTYFADEAQPSVTSENIPTAESREPQLKSSEEAIETLKGGAEKLGEVGSKAVTALRTLFEQIKDKIKRKDLEKLEREITEIEEEKKIILERAGLLQHKKKLEDQLREIKSRKLEGLI